jgi:hypothetical protein
MDSRIAAPAVPRARRPTDDPGYWVDRGACAAGVAAVGDGGDSGGVGGSVCCGGSYER